MQEVQVGVGVCPLVAQKKCHTEGCNTTFRSTHRKRFCDECALERRRQHHKKWRRSAKGRGYRRKYAQTHRELFRRANQKYLAKPGMRARRRKYDKKYAKRLGVKARRTHCAWLRFQTANGKRLSQRGAHRRSLKIADRSKTKVLKNGWPDETHGAQLVEIKRGTDFLSAAQIVRHRWFEKVFNTSVQIHWYPKVNGKKKLIFANWKAFIDYFEE